MSTKQKDTGKKRGQQPRAAVEPDLDGLRIAALDVSTWPQFAALVERHNGIFGGCWCTFFGPDCPEKRQSYEGNRALKQRWVEEDATHAALVLDGEEAVGWAEFGPPEELPNLHHRKQYLAEQQQPPDFRVTCIFVDRRYRRRGVAELALRGAVELIAAAGEASSRDIRTTSTGAGCRRRSSTTAPAGCTSASASSTTAPRGRATASWSARWRPRAERCARHPTATRPKIVDNLSAAFLAWPPWLPRC
ncbi:GNAT family N-acetyltransferase [Barrientosiimonas endolithica]|nr:GNAT family N-acetyltransferase [Barrientosiimonas endolithica]